MTDAVMDLSGRVALVTGAGQGVGAETCRYLAAHGAKVVVNDYVLERAADGGRGDPRRWGRCRRPPG